MLTSQRQCERAWYFSRDVWSKNHLTLLCGSTCGASCWRIESTACQRSWLQLSLSSSFWSQFLHRCSVDTLCCCLVTWLNSLRTCTSILKFPGIWTFVVAVACLEFPFATYPRQHNAKHVVEPTAQLTIKQRQWNAKSKICPILNSIKKCHQANEYDNGKFDEIN